MVEPVTGQGQQGDGTFFRRVGRRSVRHRTAPRRRVPGRGPGWTGDDRCRALRSRRRGSKFFPGSRGREGIAVIENAYRDAEPVPRLVRHPPDPVGLVGPLRRGEEPGRSAVSRGRGGRRSTDGSWNGTEKPHPQRATGLRARADTWGRPGGRGATPLSVAGVKMTAARPHWSERWAPACGLPTVAQRPGKPVPLLLADIRTDPVAPTPGVR